MKSKKLNVEKVLKEFRQYEESSGHRKGTFKLDVPFEQAVKKISKAKPESKTKKVEVKNAGKRSNPHKNTSADRENSQRSRTNS